MKYWGITVQEYIFRDSCTSEWRNYSTRIKSFGICEGIIFVSWHTWNTECRNNKSIWKNSKFLLIFKISIKPAPSSFREPTASEIFSDNYALERYRRKIFDIKCSKLCTTIFCRDRACSSTTDFSQHTNALAYKLEDVFVPTTPDGGPVEQSKG